ncbi:MAG: hypothetical protein Q8T13_19875 [Acidobacteriota bacterium]|nr:hypothetical protein [Acidobacteriota bacterium]
MEAIVSMDAATYSRWLRSEQIARLDAPRSVRMAHAAQRQEGMTAEQVVAAVAEEYGLHPSSPMALRLAEAHVVATQPGSYDLALARRDSAVTWHGADVPGVPKPWDLALQRRAAEVR